MASRKRKAPASVSQARYDKSRFVSQDAWDHYADNVLGRKIISQRNVKLYITNLMNSGEKLRGGIGIRSSLTSLEGALTWH